MQTCDIDFKSIFSFEIVAHCFFFFYLFFSLYQIFVFYRTIFYDILSIYQIVFAISKNSALFIFLLPKCFIHVFNFSIFSYNVFLLILYDWANFLQSSTALLVVKFTLSIYACKLKQWIT